jgi:hypothetical protein
VKDKNFDEESSFALSTLDGRYDNESAEEVISILSSNGVNISPYATTAFF